jgi:class 3 adenylate cyclase
MQARVGLNSGEVVVRAIGNDLHMDYSAVGQTTHLAARMEQLATPGSIRLTAATLRLAEGLVQVNALGPVPIRGLREPIEPHTLRNNARCTWQPSEGSRNVHNTAIRRAFSPLTPCGRVTANVHG